MAMTGRRLSCLLTCFLLMNQAGSLAAENGTTAERILKATGIGAGVCVHLGCGEGGLMADLARSGNFYVHGLETEQAVVDKARAFLQAEKLYTRVSAERSDFKSLPYAENLINLVVIDNLPRLLKQGLLLKEVLRVLVPNGAAYLRDQQGKLEASALKKVLSDAGIKEAKIVSENGVWALIRKPWPKGMDEWSHPNHGADGNPVSKDTVAGPAQQLQWIAPPLWGHHRGPDGAVSAGGRLFYVLMDRPLNLGPVGRFHLTARDAFNGRLLWRRQVESRKTTYSHCAMLPIGALIATKERLYVVLKSGEPLKALDVNTGKELKSFDEHPSPTRVIHSNGTLLLISGGAVRAVNAADGKLLWKRSGGAFKVKGIWSRTGIVVGDGTVFFRQVLKKKGPLHFVAIDLKSGEEKWKKPLAELIPASQGKVNLNAWYKGNLLLAGGGAVHAVSPTDGTIRWSHATKKAGLLYGLRDGVWITQGRQWQGLDLKTGKPTEIFKTPKELPPNIKGKRILDGQCNFPTATERFFIVTTRMSLVDTQYGKFYNSMFTRAPCKYLLALPANGQLYTFPKDCGCYPCLRGLLSYAPERPTTKDEVKGSPAFPLEKGPAFGKLETPDAKPETGEDWPMHRNDGQRRAASSTAVPGAVKPIWSKTIGEKISAATIAEGKVFVAAIDAHQVHALDEKTGKPLWMFTAGGRVDSPPTIYKGLCAFGSRDGWVYCLRAHDGALVWRLRAAPYERRIGAWNQLESAWPVFGTVLVHNDVIYCSAGRHANTEGGIKVHAIEPTTGKILWTNGPGYEIVNNVLTLTPSGNIYLGKYKVAYNPKTGKAAKDRSILQTHYAGMLTESAGPAWGGADLTAFGKGRKVNVFSGKPYIKKNKKGRTNDVPGSGYEIGFSRRENGKVVGNWKHETEPIRFNALVLTKDVVFAAGGLEFKFDPKAENPWAFLDGDRGGKLKAYAVADGKPLGEVKIDAIPVFDGLSAANGRVFLSTKDGKITCYGAE